MADAYQRDAAEVADLLGVVSATGLSTADAEQRADAWGVNELAEPACRSQGLRLLDQFRSRLRGQFAADARIHRRDQGRRRHHRSLPHHASIGYLQERAPSTAWKPCARYWSPLCARRRQSQRDPGRHPGARRRRPSGSQRPCPGRRFPVYRLDPEVAAGVVDHRVGLVRGCSTLAKSTLAAFQVSLARRTRLSTPSCTRSARSAVGEHIGPSSVVSLGLVDPQARCVLVHPEIPGDMCDRTARVLHFTESSLAELVGIFPGCRHQPCASQPPSP
ncbi:cation-transporting P-type ATPase [Streptomyces cyaneofuscatus]|uniref:cation-transporting P-type ATPase n=1 Tax=Streptomyces cyaneofuscatus TaxID=66883 RepID=UPI00364A5F78